MTLLSPDPAGRNHVDFNPFAYANNNPYKFVDPDGRESGCLYANSCGNFSNVGREVVSVLGTTAEGIDALDREVLTPLGPHPIGVGGKAAVLPLIKLLKPISAEAKTIRLSTKAHGEAAEHARDAIAADHPDVLTIAREGADANRAAAIGDIPKVAGKQLDEYPPAMFSEGGSGASVRPINPSDNMSAGACIGNSCRGLPNGAKVKIIVDDDR